MNKWSETELSKIGNVVSGGTPSTSNSDYWSGDILFVTPYDLSRNETPYLNDTERKISTKGLENSSATLVPAGSIVISSRAPIGYIAIGSTDFTTNQGCKSIIPNSDFESLFLYYCFHFYVERIKKLGAGSTFAEISKKDLESVKFPHPTDKKEQQKISYILNTADTVIEKTQAAIAKYKAIKQGMLHDLFTRGIDLQTGKLRPKYEDAPELYKECKLRWIPKEWEEKIIDDVAWVNGRVGWKGYTVADLRETGPLALGAAHIDKENKLDLTNPIHLSVEKYLESPEIMVRFGDILIVQRGTIGKIVIIDKEIGEATINPSMVLLNNLKVNSAFLYFQLCSFIGQRQIEILTSQTGVPMISQEQIKNINLGIPKKPVETEEIAKRLISIDKTIVNEQQQLKKLQQIKAGLMGDLLSGKKEVKITDKEEVSHG